MPSSSTTTAQPKLQAAETPDRIQLALESIVRIQQATDPPQLLDRMMHATTLIGASASIYSISIPEDGTEPSTFSLFASHPVLAQDNSSRGALAHHPWLRCARSRSTPATQRQVETESPADIEAIDLARQYGFRSCLIVPVRSTADPERVEMLCLGSIDDEAFEGEGARLVRMLARAMAAELHDWVGQHLKESLRLAASLRKPDIELLKFEFQGLGTKEIAQRTGMTLASVDSRFQRINARLACTNRKASARRAAAYGLLEAG